MRQLLFSCLVLCATRHSARGEELLSVRVDQLISDRAEGPVAPPADDATFVRRVYLDFAGRIPSVAEARAFLDDAAADKRQRLIDVLLASPEYSQRMADVMHVMLMERLGDHEEWRKFLVSSFKQNSPWDKVVRAILHPNADDEATRGAAFFFTKRLETYGQQPVDLPGLTRDVGRLFLGVDLQCAQCHDHLFIDDYKQADFQGLHAFVSHTTIRRDTKFPAVAENLVDKKAEFMSVFVQEPRSTGPRLPFGDEVEVATFAKGEEYVVPPDRKTQFPGAPKFSPLAILAEQLPTRENAAFCRNSVNRWWWVLMGRGLVDPLDQHHAQNPPSHPELLNLLAQEFATHDFNVKWLLREVALTQTYQLASRLEGVEQVPEQTFRVALERPLSAEQLLSSMQSATGTQLAEADLRAAREKFQKAFASVPREPEIEFAPSVKGALFVLNDPLVLGWFQPAEGNRVQALTALPDEQVPDELYMAVLSRRPTDEERTDVRETLAGAGDRGRVVGDLLWGLLASTEFALNH
jgi:hypothetical protein